MKSIAPIASLAIMFSAAARQPAAATLPQLSGMVGTWTCAYKGPYGTRTLTATGKQIDQDWLDLKGGPDSDTFVSYDAKRGAWVQFRTGPKGRAVMLVADGPPTATTLRWTMLYPRHEPAGTTTISVPDASKRIITTEYVEHGTRTTSTAICTRS